MFTTLIGARVVLRRCPRCRALSNILFRRGLLVFCGTGGLVGRRRNVGRLLAVGDAVVLLPGVVPIAVVSFASSSVPISFTGFRVVVRRFLGRKNGRLFISATFPPSDDGRRLGNKSDNFDLGLNLLRDLPPNVGLILSSFSNGVVNSVVVNSSSDEADVVVSSSSVNTDEGSIVVGCSSISSSFSKGSISDTWVTLGRFRNLILIVGRLPPRMLSNSFLRELLNSLLGFVAGEDVVVRRLWTICCKRLILRVVSSKEVVVSVVVSVGASDTSVVVGRDGLGGIGIISKSLVFSGTSTDSSFKSSPIDSSGASMAFNVFRLVVDFIGIMSKLALRVFDSASS